MNIHQRTQLNYVSQFAILAGALGILMVIGAAVAGFVASSVLHVPIKDVEIALKNPANANFIRWLNVSYSAFSFFLPAFILAVIISRKPFAQLGFNDVISGKQMFLVILMALAAMILSEALGELNQLIPLPAKWLAKAKAFEKEYSDTVAVMATMKDVKGYLLSLFVIALCPAIFEEVLFRGGFQQVFLGWFQKPWVAIAVTSIIFSAIHFSFFGFLPRAGLSIILGYVFYYSKNIWLNIALHFLNNAIIVTIFYRFSLSGKPIEDVEKISKGSLPGFYIWIPFTVFILISLFKRFQKESERIRPVSSNISPDETILPNA